MFSSVAKENAARVDFVAKGEMYSREHFFRSVFVRVDRYLSCAGLPSELRLG